MFSVLNFVTFLVFIFFIILILSFDLTSSVSETNPVILKNAFLGTLRNLFGIVGTAFDLDILKTYRDNSFILRAPTQYALFFVGRSFLSCRVLTSKISTANARCYQLYLHLQWKRLHVWNIKGVWKLERTRKPQQEVQFPGHPLIWLCSQREYWFVAGSFFDETHCRICFLSRALWEPFDASARCFRMDCETSTDLHKIT